MTDLLSVPPASLEELRRDVERLRLLHTITLEFNASLDFDQLLPRVFDRVLAAVGAAGGSLWIAEGDMLHCRLAVGGGAARLVGATMPVGTGFVGVRQVMLADLRAMRRDGSLGMDMAFYTTGIDLTAAVVLVALAIVWLENDGQAKFRARPLQVGTCLHPALCLADFNKDGRLDIAAANFYEDAAQPRPVVDVLLAK